MSDPRRRIIVDGIDAESMLRIPLLVRSVAAAVQPPRILIALGLVLVIGMLGRGWDLLRGPRIDAGVLQGQSAVALADQAAELVLIAQRWATAPLSPETLTADPAIPPAAAALTIVDRGYRRWVELEAGAPPTAPDPDAGPDADAPPADTAFAGNAAFVDDAVAGRSVQQWRADRRRIAAMTPRGEFAATGQAVRASFATMADGLVSVQPSRFVDGVRTLVVTLPARLATHAPVFLVVFGLLVFVGWGIAGGAIARIAACFVSGGQRISAADGLRFARRAWGDLLLAPAVPLIVVGLLTVPAILSGLLLQVPGLNIVGGVLALIAVPLAIIGGGIGLAAFASVPLAGPAIAVERCDAIDAAQRPIAYLIQRPFRTVITLLLCLIAAVAVHALLLGVGAAGGSLARGAATLVGPDDVLTGDGAGGVFAALPPVPAVEGVAWHERAATWLVSLAATLVAALGAAIVGSVWVSTTTTGFMVLREQCDGQDLEDVWQPGVVPGTLSGIMPGPVSSSAERPRSDRRRRDPVAPTNAASESGDTPLMVEKSPEADEPAEAPARPSGAASDSAGPSEERLSGAPAASD